MSRLTRSHLLRAGTAGCAALLSAACGSAASRSSPPAAQTAQPVTLELFGADTPGGAPQTQELLDAFHQKQPTIQVNYSYLQNGKPYREKLKVAVSAGTPPDVFYLEWFVYPPYVVAGHLAQIDGLAKKDWTGVAGRPAPEISRRAHQPGRE